MTERILSRRKVTTGFAPADQASPDKNVVFNRNAGAARLQSDIRRFRSTAAKRTIFRGKPKFFQMGDRVTDFSFVRLALTILVITLCVVAVVIWGHRSRKSEMELWRETARLHTEL